ncbi:kinetochore-associated Ndc80 complex subunit nuf2 [Agyrium rufum]|nr:kinetochore-associated Ndc80 complex subunit nuf2 [Agyrium rufum]
MTFNTRMSQQFQSSSQHNGYRSKQKPDDSDTFMRLPDREIAGCITDIGVPFSAEDLQKPNPQHIQKVFEWCAELLLNTTRETVEPAMRAAAEDVCGENNEIIPVDTRNLMGFYVSLRKLLLECGIHDFSFSDLTKPTHERLVKIFSHLINFIRFREAHTGTIDTHFNKAEVTKARIENLYSENQDMEARLQQMRLERKSLLASFKDKEKQYEDIKNKLLTLRKNQEKITVQYEGLREERGRLTKTLEDRTTRWIQLQQDSSKLRPYASQSSAALQANLVSLGDSLSKSKNNADSLEKRHRALHTSADTFTTVQGDVASCTKVLTEISAEIAKEEEEATQAARRKDALSERSNNVREVERGESHLQRQLTRLHEKTQGLREGSNEKAEAARKRMEELKVMHKGLMEEGAVKRREIDSRRMKVEVMEKKAADLKENIAGEIHATHDEYMKMEAHINLYIKEMEQSIQV